MLLSSRGSHGISVGDVIEVYHSDDVHHVLFLVTVLRDDVQTRGKNFITNMPPFI